MTRRALIAPLAHIARDSIVKLAQVEGRSLTMAEAAAVRALASIAPARVSTQRARAVRTTAPIPLPKGTPVAFQTAGRAGTSPVRKGIVKGFRSGSRGTWLEIAEDGAAEGIVVRTRGSMVRSL